MHYNLFVPIHRCFISNFYVLLGTVLIPIYLVMLFNYVIFVIVVLVIVKKMCRGQNVSAKTNQSSTANLKLMMGIFSVSVVLGLTWIFGAFIVSESSQLFRYLFVILNVFQGFIFFVFIVLIGADGRAFWIKTLRLEKLSRNLSRSNQITRTNFSSSSPKATSSTIAARLPGDLTNSIEKQGYPELAEMSLDRKASVDLDLEVGTAGSENNKHIEISFVIANTASSVNLSTDMIESVSDAQ